MLLLTRRDVSSPDLTRLLRERIVLPYGPGLGRPPDVPDSPALRAHAARSAVPADDVLSGLGALWVRGCAPPPSWWHTAAPRGTRDRAVPPVTRHQGPTSDCVDRVAGLRVAPVPRAAVDALRWERLADALPAVARALTDGRLTIDELTGAAAEDRRGGPDGRRVSAALACLAEALRAPIRGASRP